MAQRHTRRGEAQIGERRLDTGVLATPHSPLADQDVAAAAAGKDGVLQEAAGL
jgi:hypothetical protein